LLKYIDGMFNYPATVLPSDCRRGIWPAYLASRGLIA
jgi:hypothetical protein